MSILVRSIRASTAGVGGAKTFITGLVIRWGAIPQRDSTGLVRRLQSRPLGTEAGDHRASGVATAQPAPGFRPGGAGDNGHSVARVRGLPDPSTHKGMQGTGRRMTRFDAWCAGHIRFAEFDASVSGWTNHVRCADSWGLRPNVLGRFVWGPEAHRAARSETACGQKSCATALRAVQVTANQ